ncbi:PAS domain-containing protein [Methanofollis ethanolicus]|jgi:PAS domain-containing protein|uniref:PAS domain-containing protein n=1 Tax=Methanofollis ethanolicus TaxID=488124 RepID=UPI00082A0923|nr:PAS domain-containing protein [Methanofollis ethanolicus]
MMQSTPLPVQNILTPISVIINELDEGIAILDPNGQIVQANRKLEELAGCRPSSDAIEFIIEHFTPVRERKEIFAALLKTTFKNRLIIRGFRCRSQGKGGRQIEYSTHVINSGPFTGLRIDQFQVVQERERQPHARSSTGSTKSMAKFPSRSMTTRTAPSFGQTLLHS